MKSNFLKTTQLLTVTGIFCSILSGTTALAQRTSGPDVEGFIIEVTAQGQVYIEQVEAIEGHCAMAVVNSFLSRGPIRPEAMLKTVTANRVFHWSYSTADYKFAGLNTSPNYTACNAAIQRSTYGRTGSVIPYEPASMSIYLDPICMKEAPKNRTQFSIKLINLPAIQYQSQIEWAKNDFGVPFKTDRYTLTNISIDSLSMIQNIEALSENKEVVFSYPISQFVACLRNGLNKLGVSENR